jgi:hypothetical protein
MMVDVRVDNDPLDVDAAEVIAVASDVSVPGTLDAEELATAVDDWTKVEMDVGTVPFIV